MVVESAIRLHLDPVGWNWLLLAVLTLLSGSATVKLPSVPATISVSETFVFTSVLLFGPAAGTLTVALDALVLSLWLTRRGHPFYRIAFNVFALPAALWVGAHLYYALGHVPPLHTSSEPINISTLALPLFAFTVTYFILNSSLVAIAISVEKQTSALAIWRHNFAWLSLNYVGGASVAALLVTYTRDIDYAYLAFVLPLLAILYLTFRVSMGRVEDANRHLSELNRLYLSTIETLAMAIDAKDQITHGHVRRVQHYAVRLANRLGVTDQAQISAIEAASLLHDMGKLAVPEYILNKPGRLTAAEFEKMKLHASAGADILSAIDFPYPVVPIVRHHHESWDGTGYPDGLRGSDIPIGARILSVVDCFDALTSDRPYRPRLTDQDAIRILLERRGSMYDPLVVDTFIGLHAEATAHSFSGCATQDGTVSNRLRQHEERSPLGDISAGREEMLALYELAQTLSGPLTLSQIGEALFRHLSRLFPPTIAALFVYEPDSDDLVIKYTSGETARHLIGSRIHRGERLSGWVAANQQTIVNSDPVLDLGEAARTFDPPLKSCLSTPILKEESLLGVVTLYSSQREAFHDEHRRILEAAARQISNVGAWQTRRYPTERARRQPTLLPASKVHSPVDHKRQAAPNTSPSPDTVILLKIHIGRTESTTARDDLLGDPLNTLAEMVFGMFRETATILRLRPQELLVVVDGNKHSGGDDVVRQLAVSIATAKAKQQIDSAIAISVGIAVSPSDGSTLVELLRSAERSGRPVSHFSSHTSIH